MYTVFARKYRPQSFDDVVGQEHVVTTLRNAVAENNVGHAYLFCGPRGIGKTSIARIFAKALNCRKGPTTNPCGRCESCLAIAEGNDVDVIEIDAASNRGVDDIRSLRENAQYAPLRSRHKIYIMDESHQLTVDACNALLKVLEEPPPHVKFIFATTAVHKMISTIVSRCQRFDFRRITTADIAHRLKRICAEEKLKVADNSLMAVARIAGGAMRDSQSLLDQLISYKGADFTPADVHLLIGASSPETCYELLRLVKAGDIAPVILLVNRVFAEGIDPIPFLDQLSDAIRNVLIAKTCPETPGLLDIPEEEIKLCRKEGEGFSVEALLYATQILFEARRRIRDGIEPQVAVEIVAIKLCKLPDVADVKTLLEELKRVEGSMKSSAASIPSHQPLPPSANATPAKTPPSRVAATAPEREEEAEPLPAEAGNIDGIGKLWPNVIEEIKQSRFSLAAILKEGKPRSLEGGDIEILFPPGYSFHKTQVEISDNRRAIEAAVERIIGKPFTIRFAIENASGATPAPATPAPLSPISTNNQEVLAEPLVRKVLETFDGNVVGMEG